MKYFITALLICVFGHLEAQIKSFDLGGVLLTGNNKNVQITSKMSYELNNKKKDIGVSLNPYYFLFYGQKNDQFIKQSEDARLNIFSWKEIKNNYSAILFSTVEHSLVKNLDLSVSGGIGIKKSFKTNKLGGSVSLAYVYDRSEISKLWFGSKRASYRHTLKYKVKDITIENNVLIQPAVASTNDLIWARNTVGNYNLSITKSIAKTTSIGFVYEGYLSTISSELNKNIQPLDQRFSLIFKYSISN
jgi:hypothetical protein